LPIANVTRIDLPNNHLQYLITWYGLALALAGVVGAYWLKSRRQTVA
jgi:surfeit locus 1 family protein